ncbi:CCCH zinc finger dna binding protein [Colletotrichum tofieldiae]|nr:CCCH zinc finger dna binding protein [Colletotrichum tofieldiae]
MPTTTNTTTRVTSGTKSYLDNINANTNAAPVLPPYLRTSSQSPLNLFPFSPSNAFPSAIGTGIPKERTGATKMSLNTAEIMDFVTRYQTLQGYQNASDQLIKQKRNPRLAAHAHLALAVAPGASMGRHLAFGTGVAAVGVATLP